MLQFYISMLKQKLCLTFSTDGVFYSVHKLSVGNNHKKSLRFYIIIHNYYCVIGKRKCYITFYFIELQCNYTW